MSRMSWKVRFPVPRRTVILKRTAGPSRQVDNSLFCLIHSIVDSIDHALLLVFNIRGKKIPPDPFKPLSFMDVPTNSHPRPHSPQSFTELLTSGRATRSRRLVAMIFRRSVRNHNVCIHWNLIPQSLGILRLISKCPYASRWRVR
jgi:hypothetical protein